MTVPYCESFGTAAVKYRSETASGGCLRGKHHQTAEVVVRRKAAHLHVVKDHFNCRSGSRRLPKVCDDVGVNRVTRHGHLVACRKEIAVSVIEPACGVNGALLLLSASGDNGCTAVYVQCSLGLYAVCAALDVKSAAVYGNVVVGKESGLY